MSGSKPMVWISALLTRFEDQLPLRSGDYSSQARNSVIRNKQCLVSLSKLKFPLVINSLTDILRSLDTAKVYGYANEKYLYESYVIVLNTIRQCLSCQTKESSTSRLDETIFVNKLLSAVCKLLHVPGESEIVMKTRIAASDVLYSLSTSNYNVMYSKIISRLESLSLYTDETYDFSDIELIKYIDVDISKLWRLLTDVVQRWKSLKKNCQFHLVLSLNKAIWNWINAYPEEFSKLQKEPYIELNDTCKKFFEILDNCAEYQKRRIQYVWHLKVMILILSPAILEEVICSIEKGSPCSQEYFKQKNFLENLKKALHINNSKQPEVVAAVISLVKLCKVSTYIKNEGSNSSVFLLVQNVLFDLKNILFNVNKLFSSGPDKAKEDLDLMMDFFLTCYRLLPHNNEVLKICLNSSAPSAFHYVLAKSLHSIITEKRLAFWPTIDVFYFNAFDLRNIFLDTICRVNQSMGLCTIPLKMSILNLKDKVSNQLKLKEKFDGWPNCKELLHSLLQLLIADPFLMLRPSRAEKDSQKGTFELMNSLVLLVHASCNIVDLASMGMQAITVLHRKECIENWNPDSPVTAFWRISSHVLFCISQRLAQQQTADNVAILRWLKKILILRNAFLFHYKDEAYIGSSIPIATQAQTKLEVVLFLCLWNSDIEVAKIAMSSFSHICEEADIRLGFDELTVRHVIPNYNTYMEFNAAAKTITLGRSGLQKKIFSLLRKIAHPTYGNQQAWHDTYAMQQCMTKCLISYPRIKLDDIACDLVSFRLNKARTADNNSTELEIFKDDAV